MEWDLAVGLNFLLLTQCVFITGNQILKLEAEHYWPGFSHQFRKNASQEKTVSMQENDVMSVPFCLRTATAVTIYSIHYSNDGLPNEMRISIDGTMIGSAMSHNSSDRGNLWNEIDSVGPVGNAVNLASGPHKLLLFIHPTSASTRVDPYGIEIDAIYLHLSDSDTDHNFLLCQSTMCSDYITYRDRHYDRDDIPTGRIMQMSRPTTCAEENNVKVPIYHENIRQFRVSAIPPRYRTFWSFKDADFEGCPEYSKYHWQYLKVECNLASNDTRREHKGSVLTIGPSVLDPSLCELHIDFDLPGMRYGKTAAHIGGLLEIIIDPDANVEVEVKPRYGVTENGTLYMTYLNSATLNPSTPGWYWNVSDFTWAEKDEDRPLLNTVRIAMKDGTILDYVQLRRREEHPQTITNIYDNEQMKIQKIVFDFWWRDPLIYAGKEDNMAIYTADINGETFHGYAHYIRVIEKRVWSPTGDMDQTFVLYQDGGARILPIVPHGMSSYVPFGSDIVIGQADPTHIRPNAPIKKVVLHPVDHLLDVYYQDGGFAILHLHSEIEATNVTVKNISYASTSKDVPFAIFRSTWVEDGRAKVDHVTVNGLPAKHILLDRWTNLYGTNFVFFRKCISVYNSQSPDYVVEIMSDSELG